MNVFTSVLFNTWMKTPDANCIANTLAPGVSSGVLYAFPRASGLLPKTAAQVLGIRVDVAWRASIAGVRSPKLGLLLNGTYTAKTDKCVPSRKNDACVFSTAAVGTEPIVSFGGPTDMWGLTAAELTPAIHNADNFGIAIGANNGGSVNANVCVNYVSFTVWYC